MKRFLFKFFFVLMALIAAIPAQAKIVFYKNTNNWDKVNAHIWYGTNTSATDWPGKPMTNLGDGWWCFETGDCTKIVFNGGSLEKKTADLDIPTDQKECAYNNGWNKWTGYTLYLNHPWGGGSWGTWKQATNNYDGTFSLVANYGGNNDNTGCDYGYTASKTNYVLAENDNYVKAIPKGTECTFTFDRRTNKLTIREKIEQLAKPTFTPDGGTFTSAQSVTISAANGATIYYTTDGSEPSTSSAVYDGNAITISTTTTLKAIAVKEGYKNSEIASATYTYDPKTGECYFLPNNTADNAQQMAKNADGSFTITVDIDNKSYFGFATKATTKTEYQLGTNADGPQWWITSGQLDKDITLVLGSTKNFKMEYATGTYTITIAADYSTVKFVKSIGIPVFPLGVNSEAELSAYDFEANPVYYLLSTVLNNNRVTPEWQMTKGANGLYHLNGFAMRNTSCRNTDGSKNIEGYIKVRQYVDATSFEEYGKQQLNDLPKNPLTEGKLYNATFDPTTGKLTLTEDASAKGKMPFISLVGYMMQQDQVYTTPRGIDKTPEGTTTAIGWQEAWLQYDANGKLLKDRAGNVMYSTMWPPKNPVYFTATVGENQRLYSSDQMTFVPVKDAKGDYVGKTGAEWEAELKTLDKEAYKGLDLVDDKTYYRYVVSDIWYVGAGKIWTGWGSQITYSNNNPIAQWSNHTNWGYLDKRANDTDGSPIDPETTYGVGTNDKTNGNFLFKDPTYFKTFEFFYETGDPKNNSQIYTTRAYGSASIAAQNVKEGESYKKGSYQAKVTVPEGVTISSWTITRHDATTDALAPIGSDNGKVATYTAEKTDPTSTTFTVDEEGLGEGRYYYELTVTFSNGRTSTVRSNPFIIYHPGVYTLDANGYQLVKLDEAVNGYEYVTYNSKENGEMYLVNIADDAVTAYAVLPTDKRDAVKALLSSNEGIKWTDKVFVYAPVPSSFKIDAEKNNSTIKLEDITGYTLGTTTVPPFNAKELVKLDNKGNFAQRTYKAVMNYKEADPNTQAKTDKSTLGKENITMMQMPNVKAKGSIVTVDKIPNSEVLDIIDGEATKQKACNYYEVTLALNFDDPNVITAKAPRFKIGDKVYEGVNAGTRSITIACVNPLDFANAASDITVDAVYYDGTDYTLPATIGEAAVLKADDAKFQMLAHPEITFVDAITSKMLGKHVVAVTEMSTIMDGADKIGETELDDEYYNVKFAIDDHATPDFSQILTKDDINFTGVLEDKGDYKIWSKFHWFENTTGKNNMKFRAEVTPMYVAHVTNQASTENLQIIPGETPATAEGEGTYVALNGNPADRTIENGITTGVTDINTLAPRARKVIENGEIHIICGDRKYNVMGAEIR